MWLNNTVAFKYSLSLSIPLFFIGAEAMIISPAIAKKEKSMTQTSVVTSAGMWVTLPATAQKPKHW